MSYKPNEDYKENVWDHFQQALDTNDFEQCERIIANTKEAGFSLLARSLDETLAIAQNDFEANLELDDNTHAYGLEY